jgi:predicted porin
MKHATAGKIVFGRLDTPFKTLGRKVEMFPDQLGDFRSMTDGWDNRLTELVAYVSPDWDGFSIFAAYQFDQVDALEVTKADWEAETAMSAMAAYSTEQFMIGAAYEAAFVGLRRHQRRRGRRRPEGHPAGRQVHGRAVRDRRPVPERDLPGIGCTPDAGFEDWKSADDGRRRCVPS